MSKEENDTIYIKEISKFISKSACKHAHTPISSKFHTTHGIHWTNNYSASNKF